MTPALDPRAAESLLAFWAEAGVDACFDVAPVDRTALRPAPARAPALKAVESVRAAPVTADCVAEARRLAWSATTLGDLAEIAAAFDGCGLKAMGARRAVFGSGPDDAPLLVVGAQPTEAEDLSGEPFAGASGRLFDKMLAAAGLTGKDWRLNAVFWRPPGDRQPSPEEQAACLPFVERALDLLRPKAVLLLGSGPARAIFGAAGGSPRLRGTWRDWRLSEGGVTAPTLTTFNPGFLIQQSQMKRLAWSDMLSLAARLDGGGKAVD